MEVTTSITPPCTANAMKIIDIGDDDDNNNDVDKDVSIIYSTSKSSKRKRTNITEPVSVEEYFVQKNFESVRSKHSNSATKKVFIDLSEEYTDDEIQFFGSKFSLNSSNSMQSNETFMCEICVDEKPMTESFQIMGCDHSYCKECTVNYIASKLQQNITRISCPVVGCNVNYEPYYCRSILPKQVFDRWGDVLCEAMIMDSNKVYCPYENCSALLLIDDECRGPKLLITETKCPECKRLFCVTCNVPWHTGIMCEEFQKLDKDERGRDDILLVNLAKVEQWQRCPKCRFYVGRSTGCPAMRCRCGCLFCYKCGAENINNHKCPKYGT